MSLGRSNVLLFVFVGLIASASATWLVHTEYTAECSWSSSKSYNMDLCFQYDDFSSWKQTCSNSGGMIVINSSRYTNIECNGVPSYTEIVASYEEGSACSETFACQEAEDDQGHRVADLSYSADCASPRVGFLRIGDDLLCADNDELTDLCEDGALYCSSSWLVATEYSSDCTFRQSYNIDTSLCIQEQDSSWRYSCTESSGQVVLSKLAYDSPDCLGAAAETTKLFTAESEACSDSETTTRFSCQWVEDSTGVQVGELYEGGGCSGAAIGSLRKEAGSEYGFCEPTTCRKNAFQVGDLFKCSIDQCLSTISSAARTQLPPLVVALFAFFVLLI